MRISVKWSNGGRAAYRGDEERAIAAAYAVLDAADVLAADAFEDYQHQWRDLDLMPDEMTGPGAVWVAACDAANAAATAGWHNPDAVWVELSI